MNENDTAGRNTRLGPEDVRIATLGEPHVACPKVCGRFVSDEPSVSAFITKKEAEEHGDAPVFFEEAGPRERIFFDPAKTKVAIVTCGGICPGINDVIRAVVMEAHHNYGVAATLGIRYGLRGFIPACRHDVMELHPGNVADIHEFGGTLLGSSRGPQSIEEIVDALERMNINFLVLIGGVGGMRAAGAIVAEIAARGLPIGVVGIPKTIDNDMRFVARTFGFLTAVEKATESIACAHTEAVGAPYGIGLLKLMGRSSGFIAATAAMGLKHVNFVLIPEERFALHGPGGFLAALDDRLTRRGHAVVVVAEGAGQHLLPPTGETDASGNPVLGDICGLIIKEAKAYFKDKGLPITLKYIDPSYIIRSVPANVADAVYCGFLGQHAVHAGMAGKTGLLVSSMHDRYVHVPLALVSADRRRIDTDSDFWQAALDSTGQARLARG
ncbi:ATP-dependent 6-phosphofructokinase [Desulfolutivibrio sulfoxidireducens]|uniref:ATP-dependent 6-phosphofructokinase n=1 Tax=Desulfolutivibrio sulfoxidireducens TaxID=2773299 RepID=UPI001FE37F66|nr:ATP-dependent 6-phosphofructokinase [Desulfolutivibrio sulfoxidireducens]QLA17469.1 ATP-dependent 6-phosphofructokinase [Desulfolutivibrio sulfoxidireducens]QLA21055.1 ATP-dependent 6-phosphofructokinase [Desulfolutivibrio sulfoxidireducens]